MVVVVVVIVLKFHGSRDIRAARAPEINVFMLFNFSIFPPFSVAIPHAISGDRLSFAGSPSANKCHTRLRPSLPRLSAFLYMKLYKTRKQSMMGLNISGACALLSSLIESIFLRLVQTRWDLCYMSGNRFKRMKSPHLALPPPIFHG